MIILMISNKKKLNILKKIYIKKYISKNYYFIKIFIIYYVNTKFNRSTERVVRTY